MADEVIKKVRKSTRRISERSSNKSKTGVKNTSVSSGQLELLVTIVPRKKAEFYTDLLQTNFEVNFQWLAGANGTANAELLKLSDWTDQSKAVIFSVIKKEHANEALHTLEDRFNKIKKGKGIAFTVPFSSVIGVATYGFLSNNLKTVKEDKNG